MTSEEEDNDTDEDEEEERITSADIVKHAGKKEEEREEGEIERGKEEEDEEMKESFVEREYQKYLNTITDPFEYKMMAKVSQYEKYQILKIQKKKPPSLKEDFSWYS